MNLQKTDIFSHIPDLKYLPRWGVLLMDCIICLMAYIISILIGSSLFSYGWDEIFIPLSTQAIIVLVVQIIMFWLFHTYSGIIRYSTFVDITKVLLSLGCATASLLILNVTVINLFGVKMLLNTALLIYLPVAFILLFCMRVGVKTIYDSAMLNIGANKKVLIYGTREAGLAIAKMLRSSGAKSLYQPIGFISDNNDPKIYSLQGLKVYPINEHLFEVMQAKNVNDIIVSPMKMQAINPAKDLDIFLQHNIRILTTEPITEWGNNNGSNPTIGRIDAIKIEDLLERPTININTDNVAEILTKKVVMVTGAAGSIGSEIAKQVIGFHPSLLLLVEQAESPLHDLRMEIQDHHPDQLIAPIIADVRNREHMEQVFRDYHPQVVFHAAAYKHVPLMEEYPNEAVLANVLGTKNIADLSVKYNVKRFVMVSTDKAVNPTNVMGASKRIAEIYVQSLYNKLQHEPEKPSPTFITTRFGNVLGSNGSVIPYFKKQIAAGGPVTVTHPDIIRFFMTIPEACTLVLEAATLGKGGEIFVFDMGQPVKILDLARKMIHLAGYRPNVDIPIRFSGLRPGEKLYEEVLNQEELTLPTENEKIKIAKVRMIDHDEVCPLIDKLIESAHHAKPMNTVKIMKEIVPEFISKNSIYEQLDKLS